jgi:hypothetical protein
MQIAAGWQGTSGAVLTDLSAVLDKIEKLPLETVRPRDRRSMLALYDLFLSFAGPTYQQERHREFVKRYKTDFASPSVEELALCLATGREFPWQIDQIEDLYTAYYRQRNQKDPLRLGREFEALLALRLAEINRVADRNGRARELIVLAVEIYPGHSALRTLEAGLGEGRMQPIKPYEILIAKKREDTAASSTPDEQH